MLGGEGEGRGRLAWEGRGWLAWPAVPAARSKTLRASAHALVGDLLAEGITVEEVVAFPEAEGVLLEGAEDGEPLVQYAAEDAARANGGECVDHRLVGRVVGGDGDSEGSEEREHQHWVVGKMRRVGELVGVGPHREHRRLELAQVD